MTDRRLERLRQINTAWEAAKRPDPDPAEFIAAAERVTATARNIFPATIELLYEVLEMRGDAECHDCQRKAALAVLDRVGVGDG